MNKYIDLIKALTPYADNEIDAFIDSEDTISFWINDGETDIIEIKAHQ